MTEYDTYTAEDRAEYDRWMQLLPGGGSDEVLYNLMRLQMKHDLQDIRTAVHGYQSIVRESDAQIAAFREQLAVGQLQQAAIAELLANLQGIPAAVTDLRAHMDTLDVSHQGLYLRVEALTHEIMERRKLLDPRLVALEQRPARLPRWAFAVLICLIAVDLVQFVALFILLW